MEHIEGKVAAILDRNTVVINRGTSDGVTRGDEAYLYSNVGPVIDPDTGEDLGMTKNVWGKVVVSIVEKRFCIAQTEYASMIDTAFLRRAWSGNNRVELPIDPDQIAQNLTRIEVGSLVIIKQRKPALGDNQKRALQEPLTKETAKEDSNEPNG